MIKLSILGPAELRDANGHLEQSFLSGPKRLALLAYLALHRPRGYKRRDSLLPLFWPNQGQASARNALSNMLYHLRQSLGENSVINRGKEEIKLGEFQCDVMAFEKAAEEKDVNEAIHHYRGTLLEGLHVPATSADFQQWLDNERERLRKSYCEVLKSLAHEALTNGDKQTAIKWWQQLIEEDPFNSTIVRRYIETLMATDRKSQAMAIARDHTALLENEFGETLSEEFSALAKDIIDRETEHKDAYSYIQPQELDPLSIAVLPFDNLNRGGETTSFAEGLHNDLLSGLSKISALSIIARSSVFRYKHSNTSLQEIAKKLRVGTIVEGSVQNTTERIRLHIQLTDARNDQLLWADTYERKLTATNLFDIQSEFSKKIINTLKTKLTSQEIERIVEKPTENLEAYHLYAQGRTHLTQRTESNIQRAISYFLKAIDYDSNYALAWAGLAEAMLLAEFYKYELSEDVPDAVQAARKALGLDPMLSEAHTSLGISHANQQSGQLAIQEFQQSIELQPSNVEAYSWLGWTYLTLGDIEKATPPSERAAELDPMAPYARVYLGKLYLAKGSYEKALNESRSARQLQPDFALTHLMEGLSLYHLNWFSEAQLALKEALALVDPKGVPYESEVLATLVLTCIALEKDSQAKTLFTQLKVTDDSFSTGLVLAALGNVEEALDAFESITNWGYFSTTYFRYCFPTVLAPIRNKPVFKKILRQVDESWGL